MSRRYIDANALMAKIDGIIEYIETEIEQAKQHPEKYARTYILSAVSQLSGIAHAQQEILEAQTAEPEIIRCKDCKHFEYDHPYIIQGIPVLGHEVCNAWGDGCKTDENGYCFMAERRTDETD